MVLKLKGQNRKTELTFRRPPHQRRFTSAPIKKALNHTKQPVCVCVSVCVNTAGKHTNKNSRGEILNLLFCMRLQLCTGLPWGVTMEHYHGMLPWSFTTECYHEVLLWLVTREHYHRPLLWDLTRDCHHPALPWSFTIGQT